MRQISSRDSALTTSVMTKSTSRFRRAREVEFLGGLRELVRDDGRHRVLRSEQRPAQPSGELPITIVTAMVSPSARPKPSMMAPKMPVRA